MNIAKKSGMYVVDLLEEYKKYKPFELKIPSSSWYDPWHPNEKGHRIAANVLFDKILSAKLF